MGYTWNNIWIGSKKTDELLNFYTVSYFAVINLRNKEKYIWTVHLFIPRKFSDEAAEFLHQAGATAIVSSISNSSEYAEVEEYRSSLLQRFKELTHEV